MSLRRVSKLRLFSIKYSESHVLSDKSFYLEEGLRIHKIACKRQGDKAEVYFKKAIRFYDKGLEGKLKTDEYKEILVQKGNCYLDHAQNVLFSVKLYKDLKTLKLDKEKADLRASSLLKSAIHTYRETNSGLEETDLDQTACINCALALCILAEKYSSDRAVSLLEKATKLYEAAVSRTKNDVKLIQRLADTYIQLGRALMQTKEITDGNNYFLKALEKYTDACAISNSTEEDDAHRLLYNWSLAYQSIAEMTQIREEKLRLINASIDRLAMTVQFYNTDYDAFCALGDALSAKGKIFHDIKDNKISISLFQDAIDDGYKAARKIKKNKISAIVGLASAHFFIGKILLEDNKVAEASIYIEKSVKYYSMALVSSSEMDSYEYNCSLVYNYACACALCKRESSVQKLLLILLDSEWIALNDILADEHFNLYKNNCWFHNLCMKYK